MNLKLTVRLNITDLYRCINHFKKGYQPGTNIGKDEKSFLGETYSRVWIGKHLSDMFPIENGLKQRNALTIAFQLCCGACH
jgi:hypothetical protein